MIETAAAGDRNGSACRHGSWSIDLLWIVKPDVLGIDARHYQNAAVAWLTGGDPWAVTESGIPYAAGPHTLLFYAPTSVLPLTASTWVWLLVGLAASVLARPSSRASVVVAPVPAPLSRRLERQPADASPWRC